MDAKKLRSVKIDWFPIGKKDLRTTCSWTVDSKKREKLMALQVSVFPKTLLPRINLAFLSLQNEKTNIHTKLQTSLCSTFYYRLPGADLIILGTPCGLGHARHPSASRHHTHARSVRGPDHPSPRFWSVATVWEKERRRRKLVWKAKNVYTPSSRWQEACKACLVRMAHICPSVWHSSNNKTGGETSWSKESQTFNPSPIA